MQLFNRSTSTLGITTQVIAAFAIARAATAARARTYCCELEETIR